jgi:hypothetical protein
MKVGDLVKLIRDDIRGTAPGGDQHIIPAGTMGIVVPPYHLDSIHRIHRPFVKLFGDGGTRPFLAYDLEVINESR